MRIKFWGVRGSTPTPQPDNLRYGGNTSCVEVRLGDNLYVFGSAGYALPKTPVTLKAGLGFERGAFDEVAHGGKWDWTLGGEAEFKPVTLGLAYVGSNADGGDRHALVASALISW